MRDTLVEGGFPLSKISIIPSLPNKAFTPGGSLDPCPLFVVAGRLTEGKGVQVAIQALGRVPGARLVVAGEGYFASELAELARRRGVADRVSFVGRLDCSHLLELYRSAWAVLMPSLWPEPFGLTGLEAMACARAVVAFDSGDIRSWLDDGVTGLLVPWNDTTAFEEAMLRLTDRDLAVELGQGGVRQFHQRFSAERHNQLLGNLYDEVLQEGPV
jgi:glycosyltransferase involved in cell wall biosynthesis